MNSSLIQTLQAVTGKPTIDSATQQDFEHLLNEYPYFAPVQLAYALKLKKDNSFKLQTQLQKTGLFFNNPRWLQYLLLEVNNKTSAPINNSIAAPIVASALAANVVAHAPIIEKIIGTSKSITQNIVEVVEPVSTATLENIKTTYKPFQTNDNFSIPKIEGLEELQSIDEIVTKRTLPSNVTINKIVEVENNVTIQPAKTIADIEKLVAEKTAAPIEEPIVSRVEALSNIEVEEEIIEIKTTPIIEEIKEEIVNEPVVEIEELKAIEIFEKIEVKENIDSIVDKNIPQSTESVIEEPATEIVENKIEEIATEKKDFISTLNIPSIHDIKNMLSNMDNNETIATENFVEVNVKGNIDEVIENIDVKEVLDIPKSEIKEEVNFENFEEIKHENSYDYIEDSKPTIVEENIVTYETSNTDLPENNVLNYNHIETLIDDEEMAAIDAKQADMMSRANDIHAQITALKANWHKNQQDHFFSFDKTVDTKVTLETSENIIEEKVATTATVETIEPTIENKEEAIFEAVEEPTIETEEATELEIIDEPTKEEIVVKNTFESINESNEVIEEPVIESKEIIEVLEIDEDALPIEEDEKLITKEPTLNITNNSSLLNAANSWNKPAESFATENFYFENEPYYTIDYFASQGIKFDYTKDPQDRLVSKMLKFTDWLKKVKTSKYEVEVKEDPELDSAISKIASASNQSKEIVTETMAEIFAKQGRSDQAIQLYIKLSFLLPDKTTYFAAKIKDLKGI